MPRVQTLECPLTQVHGVPGPDEPDFFVQAGTAHAVWKVRSLEHDGTTAKFVLEPVDPHDVPLRARIIELPLPIASGEPT